MSTIHNPESINVPSWGGQFGVYFTDTGQMEAGFPTAQDARDHIEDLVSRGIIYEHEAKIASLHVTIEEVHHA